VGFPRHPGNGTRRQRQKLGFKKAKANAGFLKFHFPVLVFVSSADGYYKKEINNLYLYSFVESR